MKHQKYIKNIFKVLIMCLIFFAFFQTKVSAVTRADAEKALAKVAKEIIEIGQKNNILKYDNGKNRESMRKWELANGKLCADSASFVAAVYKHVFGEIATPININQIRNAFTEDNLKGFETISINNLNEDVLKPGDIICQRNQINNTSNIYMYIGEGKVVEAGETNRKNRNSKIKYY